MTPYSPWEKVYKLQNLPIVLFVIGKYAYIFRVGSGGRIFCWEDFSRGEFSMEKEFPGPELFKRSFTLGEFARIPMRNMSCILFTIQF